MTAFFESFRKTIKSFFEIKPEERLKVGLTFAYFFLTLSVIYILKPVRSSLFLDALGAEKLRYVYMGEGLFIVPVVAAYVQFAKRAPRKVLYTGVLSFLIVNLLLFRWLFIYNEPYISALFYLWVSSFSITMTTQFWMFANDIFNPSEAKRLFGIIISGGSLGGIFGGMLTQQIVRWIKTEDLLLLSGLVLFFCIFLTRVILKHCPSGELKKQESLSASGQQKEEKKSAVKLLLTSPYLLMLAALVILPKVGATIVDNQFNKVVELNIAGKEARTAFYGGFNSWLNLVSMGMQFFLTSACLRYLGVGISLWILPAGLTLLSALNFLNPAFILGMVYKIFDGSVNYSVQSASKEVLFLPLEAKDRHRVKPIIDMLGFRWAKSIGGFYIAMIAPLLGLSDERLSLLFILMVPLWLFLVWKIRPSYSRTLREKLDRHRLLDDSAADSDDESTLNFFKDEKNFSDAKKLLNHRSPKIRKMAAGALLSHQMSASEKLQIKELLGHLGIAEDFEGANEPSSRTLSEHDQKFLNKLLFSSEEHTVKSSEEFQKFILKNGENILIRLSDVLRQEGRGLPSRRRAIRILENISGQQTADLLIQTLAITQHHGLRLALISALNRFAFRQPELKINRFLIKTEIAREVKILEDLRKLQMFCRLRVNLQEHWFQTTLHKALIDESMERIFGYFELLYPKEATKQVSDYVLSHTADASMRSHAIELLSNILEPGHLLLAQRVFESSQGAPAEREIRELLRKHLKSEDRWYSLLAQCILTTMPLKDQWPDGGSECRVSGIMKRVFAG